MEKFERYDWTIEDKAGKMQWVSIDDLLVDTSYQRDIEGKNKILSIARNFSWARFGTLVVMRRDDGDMYVVDGQHRLEAVRRRGDIKKVPCTVHESKSVAHEAGAFVGCNTNRKMPSAISKYKASVIAGDELHLEVNAWLKSMGMRVDRYAKNPNVVDFPSVLLQLWSKNPVASRAALESERAATQDTPHSAIHKGLWWLEARGVPTMKYTDKLAAQGGKSAILRAIRIQCIEMNAGITPHVAGRGILSLINKGKRNKRVYVAFAGAPGSA